MDAARILSSSAIALARAIREREVTSREVVDVHVARIERVNPTIRAMVRGRFDDARREADAADARIHDGGCVDAVAVRALGDERVDAVHQVRVAEDRHVLAPER